MRERTAVCVCVCVFAFDESPRFLHTSPASLAFSSCCFPPQSNLPPLASLPGLLSTRPHLIPSSSPHLTPSLSLSSSLSPSPSTHPSLPLPSSHHHLHPVKNSLVFSLAPVQSLAFFPLATEPNHSGSHCTFIPFKATEGRVGTCKDGLGAHTHTHYAQ